ncbi:RHS repeat-associated protein [Rheinheimera pacifica]|uniref:RHS repeat domain-containing protein n=1 Tax=Rheinheimera pacifica TaxID=173990 RepID=UPI00216A106A|nr:RHS repeat-associated core domain-containing protein [Rheinheimera pacifica]MCS4308917.1 RHS repeat-associated protein [Rheinheimera pacifica]
MITDANGTIVETASFDAFGKRRNANSWQGYTNPFSQLPNLAALLNITQKGYTGHIQVDHASIIHMGGRIYDPELGRFIQADPIVQDPRDAQSLNRYTYVFNNPLSYTDPTGYDCHNQRGKQCNSAIEKQKEDTAKAAQTQGSSKTEDVSKGNQSANLQNAAKVASGQKPSAEQVLWEQLYQPSVSQQAATWIFDNVINPVPDIVNAFNAGMEGDFSGAAQSMFGIVGKKIEAVGKVGGKLVEGAEGVINAVKKKTPDITTPYKRPSGATTKAQRESVQNQPCVDCGNIANRQVADHKTPLVKEYYETGTIDQAKMRSLDAVQPQCPACSARQGAEMSRYSKQQKQELGL